MLAGKKGYWFIGSHLCLVWTSTEGRKEKRPQQGWCGKDREEIKGESSSNATCVFSRC